MTPRVRLTQRPADECEQCGDKLVVASDDRGACIYRCRCGHKVSYEDMQARKARRAHP